MQLLKLQCMVDRSAASCQLGLLGCLFVNMAKQTRLLEVLREHRTPPNASILLNDFSQCKLAMQLCSESTMYLFNNPVNPDFRLRTLDLDGDPDCHQHLISYMPYPSKKFRQNPFTTFSVIQWTDRQTDKQAGRRYGSHVYWRC